MRLLPLVGGWTAADGRWARLTGGGKEVGGLEGTTARGRVRRNRDTVRRSEDEIRSGGSASVSEALQNCTSEDVEQSAARKWRTGRRPRRRR